MRGLVEQVVVLLLDLVLHVHSSVVDRRMLFALRRATRCTPIVATKLLTLRLFHHSLRLHDFVYDNFVATERTTRMNFAGEYHLHEN